MRPLEATCLASSGGEKTAWYRQNRRNPNSSSWQGDFEGNRMWGLCEALVSATIANLVAVTRMTYVTSPPPRFSISEHYATKAESLRFVTSRVRPARGA